MTRSSSRSSLYKTRGDSIDWEHAITALDTRQLSCAPSEAAILRIAASPGDHHIPVHLARVLGSLDHASIARVTTAITRANG